MCLDRSSSGHPIPIPACRWSARCDVMRCDALARRGQSIPDSPACNCSNRRRPVERGEASIGRPASHAPKQCPSPPPSPSLSLSPTWASPTDPSEHGRVRKASSDHCAHTDTAGPSVASRAQFCFLLPGRGRDACTGARAHGHRARQRGMGRGAADRSGRGRGWSVDGSRLRARRGRRCVPWARGRALSSIDPYQPCGIDGTRAHGPPAGAVASLHAAPSNGDGQAATAACLRGRTVPGTEWPGTGRRWRDWGRWGALALWRWWRAVGAKAQGIAATPAGRVTLTRGACPRTEEDTCRHRVRRRCSLV